MKKSTFKNVPRDSFLYVILHDIWRKSRGKKRPSMTYANERNPEKALLRAYCVFILKGIFAGAVIGGFFGSTNRVN